MPAIRMTQILDLAEMVGRELDICEIGHLDQHIHDAATARPVIGAHGDLYDQPDPELLAAVPLDQQAAIQALINWAPRQH